ncbi:uncharacterized protein [Aristolochia californica]|uniref:uncharacterized protein n=1 Tax=Aristolochia californica TaxID=171875 RepID=UPI0035D951D7
MMERASFRVGADADSTLSYRCHDLLLSRVTDSCKQTLLRLTNTELKFLSRTQKYLSWLGSHRNKGGGIRIKEVLEAACSTLALKPEFILLFFWTGIGEIIARKLKDEIGASEVGHEEPEINNIDQIVGEYQSEFSESKSVMLSNDLFSSIISAMRSSSEVFKDAEPHLMLGEVLINPDTTALVALVSGTGKLLLFRDCDGKCGIICETVHSEFKELVSMYGGQNEKARADQLLKRLQFVPERMMGLSTTRKIALKNQIVFGTGDHWRAPILTANTGFVRAIYQTGMSLSTLEHLPRALTGDRTSVSGLVVTLIMEGNERRDCTTFQKSNRGTMKGTLCNW